MTVAAQALHAGRRWEPMDARQFHISGAATPAIHVHYVAPHAPTSAECPLCGRALVRKKIKPLNGVSVCKQCCHRFASRRQFAWAIDHLIFTMISAFTTVGFLLVMSTGYRDLISLVRNPKFEIGMFAYSNLLWLGFLIKDGFAGRSPGKVICGLHVIDITTRQRISFGASFKRNLATYIPLSTLIMAVQLLKGPRWGDHWANTMVVWTRYVHCLPFDQRGVLCSKCGYDLTGNLSGRCPECGKAKSRATAVTAMFPTVR